MGQSRLLLAQPRQCSLACSHYAAEPAAAAAGGPAGCCCRGSNAGTPPGPVAHVQGVDERPGKACVSHLLRGRKPACWQRHGWFLANAAARVTSQSLSSKYVCVA